MGQEIREVRKKTLFPPQMNISGEIWSSCPSGKISFNNCPQVVQCLASEILLTLPPPQYTSQHGNGPFYYELITIHFLSANESICTVLFKIQALLYEFVETKRVITKFYYPSCWLSLGF